MYNVNWKRFVRFLTPNFMRQLRQIAWLEVLVSQVKSLHIGFLLFREEIIYKLRFNSQIIYLEKRLNDKWDNTNRGIYIENTADIDRNYLYNKIELRPKTFLHNKYDPNRTYIIGDWVVYKRRVYKAVDVIPLNWPPDLNPSEWQNRRERTWFYNQSEYISAFDFIVWVPVAVVFDINEMKAVINLYKLAGKRYQILTY